MNILNILLIVLVSIFLLFFLWIFFIFIKNIKKNKGLYKSIGGQVFKGKFSLIVIISFYGLTFGLCGGLSTYIQKLNYGLQDTLVTHKASTNYSKGIDFDPNEPSTMNQEFYDLMGLEYMGNGVNHNFEESLDKKVGINDWWTNIGEEYFINYSNIAQYLLLTEYFSNQNYDASFSYEMQKELIPDITSNANESYFFLGVNNYDPLTDTRNNYGQDNSQFYSNNGQNFLNELIVYKGNINDVNKLIVNPSEPIPVAVQKDWSQKNNYDVGSTFSIDLQEYEIVAIVNIPNWLYSLHSPINLVVSKDNQTAILIDTQNMINLFNEERGFVMNYGFHDIQNTYKSHNDFSPGESAANDIAKRKIDISIFFENIDDKLIDIGSHTAINSFVSTDDLRQTLMIMSNETNQTFLIVIFTIFIIVIIFVMTLLIKKRVSDNGKQLGTLKAMGQTSTQISAAYIIFPFLLILLGGLLAIGSSIFIQKIFVHTSLNFFTFPLLSSSITPFTLLVIFALPLLISIVLCFFLAKWILRKPTLDLLTNKTKDTPNKIVRAIGYLTPSFFTFKFSYKIKGFWRAMGKSTLLFFAIFGGTALTSISLSASTMVDSIINETTKAINYDSSEYLKPTSYTKYIKDEHYNVSSPLTMGIVIEDPLNPNYFLINENFINGFINELDNLDAALNYISTNTDQTNFDKILEPNPANNTYEADYYIPSEVTLVYFSMYLQLLEKYPNSIFKINNYEIFNQTGISFSNLINFFNPSILETFKNYSLFLGKSINFKELIFNDKNIIQPSVLIKEVKDFKADLVFVDQFKNKETNWYYQPTKLYFEDATTDTTSLSVSMYDEISFTPNDKLLFSLNLDKKLLKDLVNYSGNKIPILIHETNLSWFENNFSNLNNLKVYSEYYEIDNQGNFSIQHAWMDFEIIGIYDTPIPLGIIGLYSNFESYIKLNNISQNVKPHYAVNQVKNSVNSIDYVTMNLPNSTLKNFIENSGSDMTFANFILYQNGAAQTLSIPSDFVYSQVSMIYDVFDETMLLISIFAILVAVGLVLIAIKEIIDSSKKEVSMLKTFGYSNNTATSLVLTPYIVISLISFLIAIPLSLLFLNFLGIFISSLTSITFIFHLTISQILILSTFIVSLIISLIILAYLGFRKTDPLKALQLTEG